MVCGQLLEFLKQVRRHVIFKKVIDFPAEKARGFTLQPQKVSFFLYFFKLLASAPPLLMKGKKKPTQNNLQKCVYEVLYIRKSHIYLHNMCVYFFSNIFCRVPSLFRLPLYNSVTFLCRLQLIFLPHKKLIF